MVPISCVMSGDGGSRTSSTTTWMCDHRASKVLASKRTASPHGNGLSGLFALISDFLYLSDALPSAALPSASHRRCRDFRVQSPDNWRSDIAARICRDYRQPAAAQKRGPWLPMKAPRWQKEV